MHKIKMFERKDSLSGITTMVKWSIPCQMPQSDQHINIVARKCENALIWDSCVWICNLILGISLIATLAMTMLYSFEYRCEAPCRNSEANFLRV